MNQDSAPAAASGDEVTAAIDTASKSAVIAINVIFGVSLLGWVMLALASLFIAGSPGTEKEIAVLSFVLSVWAYPFTYIVALVGSIIAYRKRAARKVTLSFALLPLVNIAWAFLSFAVLA